MELIINSKTYGEKTVLIDSDDWDKIKLLKWGLSYQSRSKVYYVISNIKINGEWKTIRLHRYILNAPKGLLVDHKNGNTLDNRKENIRVCTNSQNRANSNISKNKRGSKYKGVFLRTGTYKKYYAIVGYNDKLIYMGGYYTEVEAAEAYNEAALKYHGEFAKLNIIEAK